MRAHAPSLRERFGLQIDPRLKHGLNYHLDIHDLNASLEGTSATTVFVGAALTIYEMMSPGFGSAGRRD